MAHKDKEQRRKYHKAYPKAWYAAHRSERVSQIRAHQQRLKHKIRDIKASGCSICGYTKCIESIEFHHADANKEGCISSLVKDGCTKKVLIEIAKCKVVCANCHRELHYAGIV